MVNKWNKDSVFQNKTENVWILEWKNSERGKNQRDKSLKLAKRYTNRTDSSTSIERIWGKGKSSRSGTTINHQTGKIKEDKGKLLDSSQSVEITREEGEINVRDSSKGLDRKRGHAIKGETTGTLATSLLLQGDHLTPTTSWTFFHEQLMTSSSSWSKDPFYLVVSSAWCQTFSKTSLTSLTSTLTHMEITST